MKNENQQIQTEKLYGKQINVQILDRPGYLFTGEEGCVVTPYEILKGITLVFQDIHAESFDYRQEPVQLPEKLISIQYCREGRFEGEYENGECIYMGPQDLSVNLPSRSPKKHSFPMAHYHGFFIAILPDVAEEAIRDLEKVTGPLNIDFNRILETLSRRNKLVIYHQYEPFREILSEFYPKPELQTRGYYTLKVLQLLQLLCLEKGEAAEEEMYLQKEQVRVIKEIHTLLTRNLDERYRLQDLADRYHISLTTMKTCFKAVYGSSVGNYIREYRLQTGAGLLRNTDLGVGEIALRVGYENPSKFSEAFQRRFGETPMKYRKNFCLPGWITDSPE